MKNENEHYITVENEGSSEGSLLIKEIQTELVKREFNTYEPTKEQMFDWIMNNSKKFRKIFERVIKADPHFWQHDQESRNATLDLFENELRPKDGMVDPEEEAEKFEAQ